MPRILITRAPHQASALADGLREAGYTPILIPTIELTEPTSFAPLDSAISVLFSSVTDQVPQGFSLRSPNQPQREGALAPPFHWLLFTSANAVEAFQKRISDPEKPRIKHLATVKIAVVGPSTARAVEELLGTKPALIPPVATAQSLAEALLPHALKPDGTPTRFLLVRAEVAPNHLPQVLRSAGADVTIAPAYRTIVPIGSQQKIRDLFHAPATYPHAITFTSSSTATNLLALLEASGLTLPLDIPRISIGPITSQSLRDLDLPPHHESPHATIPSLVETILQSIK